MNHDHDTFGAALSKAALWIAAWFGAVKLGDVQLVVSIVSGALVGLLAAVNLFKSLRDLFKKKEAE